MGAQTILDMTHPAFKTIHFQSTIRTSPALSLGLPGTTMLTCLLTKSVRWIHNWTFSRRRNANVWDSLASASCLWNPQARTHTRCFPPGNKVQQVLAQCRSNIQGASNLSVPRPCRWIPMHPAAPWTLAATRSTMGSPHSPIDSPLAFEPNTFWDERRELNSLMMDVVSTCLAQKSMFFNSKK